MPPAPRAQVTRSFNLDPIRPVQHLQVPDFIDFKLNLSTSKCRIDQGAARGLDNGSSSEREKPREKAGAGAHQKDRPLATLTT
jgi:hypothetical protein